MKKSLFYYSDKELKYVEINKFYSKFVSLVLLFSTIFALIFLSGYIFISGIIYPESNVSQIRQENKDLKEKFVVMSSQISELNSSLEYLNTKDDELRLSVNLEPLTEEEKNIGIGGSVFKDMKPTNISEIKDLVDKVDYSLDLLKSKVLLCEQIGD